MTEEVKVMFVEGETITKEHIRFLEGLCGSMETMKKRIDEITDNKK